MDLSQRMKNKKRFRQWIMLRDKRQLRSKTAEELGITVDRLTEVAEDLGIPRLSINEFAQKYSREDLYNLIICKDQEQTRRETANEFNISITILRKLANELDIHREVGRESRKVQ